MSGWPEPKVTSNGPSFCVVPRSLGHCWASRALSFMHSGKWSSTSLAPTRRKRSLGSVILSFEATSSPSAVSNPCSVARIANASRPLVTAVIPGIGAVFNATPRNLSVCGWAWIPVDAPTTRKSVAHSRSDLEQRLITDVSPPALASGRKDSTHHGAGE